MAHFVKCTIESITYLRGEVVKNHPVNLDLCTSIRKSKFAWYPDNEGKPAIEFKGCDVSWVFDSERQRDDEFERIASNDSMPARQ